MVFISIYNLYNYYINVNILKKKIMYFVIWTKFYKILFLKLADRDLTLFINNNNNGFELNTYKST